MRRNAPFKQSLQISGGPLLTEHLKNLDLELQLLKRKREMIEQQQNIYSLPVSQYDQSSSYNQPFKSNRDYSLMYDDAPRYGNQQGVKRRAEPHWEHESLKPYQNKKKNVPSLFANRLGPKVNSSFSGPSRFQSPSTSFSPKPSYKPSASKSSIAQKKVQLTTSNNSGRVMRRPKPESAPNKIGSRPVSERGHLVAMALKSSAAADQALILHEDRVPSKQMTGRLELALGSIMKEMTESYGHVEPYSGLLASFEKKRVAKQTVRERIREVMLGKVVGSSADIKQQYRDKYPQETDLQLLDKVLAGDNPSVVIEPRPQPIVVTDSGNEYRSAMYNLVDARLQEVFNKMTEIYGKEGEDAEKPSNVDFTDDNLEVSTSKEYEPTRLEIVAFRNGCIKRMLPKMLRKFTPVLTKLATVDEMYDITKNALIAFAKQNEANNATPGTGHKTTPSKKTTPTKNTSGQKEGGTKPPKGGFSWPYYVKIMARPTLPKKNTMREFLDKFNTKTIKKHKGVHNLLFIGFSEKSDYDNILAANGTKIGRIALEITPSERAANKETDQSLNDSDDKLITPELDGQITDLLTSIRQSDEEDKAQASTEELKTTDNADKTDATEDGAEVLAKESTSEELATDNPDKNDAEEKAKENTTEELEENDKADKTDAIETDADDCVIEENDMEGVEIDLTENDTEVTESDETQNQAENETTKLDTSDKSVEESEKNDESAVNIPEEVTETSENAAEVPEPTAETPENAATTESAAGSPEKDADSSKFTDNPAEKEENEKNDTVTELKSEAKETGRSTPTRMTRSANATPTPSTIRTRRASRLAQN